MVIDIMIADVFLFYKKTKIKRKKMKKRMKKRKKNEDDGQEKEEVILKYSMSGIPYMHIIISIMTHCN